MQGAKYIVSSMNDFEYAFAYREEYKKPGEKDGEDPSNVTSFLPKDENYGYDRKDRPDILFTLVEPVQRHAQKPAGYMMFEGRICLDSYLNGIRDFAVELPGTISADVDGQDIEYWMRQNREISRYDIMGKVSHFPCLLC